MSQAQQNMQAAENEAIRDCIIVASVIKVEHFEMASYRGLITGAQQMGQNEVVNLLSENMQQEEQTAQMPSRAPPSRSRRPGRRRDKRVAKTARKG